MSKFEGLPSWRMISLKECSDRREKMVEQFQRYGISDYHFYLSQRYDTFNSPLFIKYHHDHARSHIGTTISHLENMRQWYLTTNEPYAIFSDDDIDLSYSEYWNFTWREFFDSLPQDWECVQLIRIMNMVSDKHLRDDPYDATLQMFWGRWWGVCSIMRRSFVRRCLERHITGPFSYDLRCDQNAEKWTGETDAISYAENVLYLDNGRIVNFPLFGELDNETTIHGPDVATRNRYKSYNFEIFRNLWKVHGANMDLSIALNPDSNISPYGVTENI